MHAQHVLGIRKSQEGFTLIEVLLGVLIVLVAVVAILGAYRGQVALSEHARNLSLAINDANRVIERIRQQNNNCINPSSIPPQLPTAFTSWDAWLSDPSNGKNMHPTTNELVVMTCQRANGAALCPRTQIGSSEWNVATSPATGTPENPMRITVAICWRHRGRTFGECLWNAATNAWDTASIATWDGVVAYPGNDTAGVIDSPAMISTLVTCHSSS